MPDTITIDTYVAEIPTLIRDDASVLQPEDAKKCVLRAADDLSARRPRSVVEDLTSDSTGDFDTADFETPFEKKYIGEIEVESPISSAGQKRRCLKPDQFELVQLPDKLVIRVFAIPPVGEAIRVTFGARHVIDQAGSTVEDEDYWFLTRMAGAEACMVLARHYTPSVERTMMNADIAIFDKRAEKFRDRAKELREEALKPPTSWGFV